MPGLGRQAVSDQMMQQSCTRAQAVQPRCGFTTAWTERRGHLGWEAASMPFSDALPLLVAWWLLAVVVGGGTVAGGS